MLMKRVISYQILEYFGGCRFGFLVICNNQFSDSDDNDSSDDEETPKMTWR